jgi:hypothetical protein
MYKKLFLIVGLLTQSMNFYANTDLPIKDDQVEQAQVQLNENETLLLLFLQQGQDAEYIQNMHLGAIEQFQQLEKIKKYVRDEQFKKPIENIEQHLTEQKKYLSNLHNFLSKKEIDLTDIQQFAPEFSQYKYMFFQSNNPNDAIKAQHAEIQDRNLILLSRLQQIEEKRSQNNLGSWMRKSPFFEKIYKEKRQE